MDDSQKSNTPSEPETNATPPVVDRTPGEPFKLPIVEPKEPWYKSKWLWIIVSLIVLGGLGTAGYIYVQGLTEQNGTAAVATVSPTPTPSTTAKPTPQAAKTLTYEQKDLGVAFDYPSTWTVKANDSADDFYGTKDNKDYRQLVVSPQGFTMLFNLLVTDGLGGAGPCDRKITAFESLGDTKIAGAYVVGYILNGKYVLNVSTDKTQAGTEKDCLRYNGIVKIKEMTNTSDTSKMKPYALTFGTDTVGAEPVSTTKPSDKELKEAVAILQSLRKAE